ncbi:MAG: Fe-S cluster assembly protein SufD [Acidiphilium sp.]|nr:Fe-S cluster assembly protein SufD [Acidiphilium sp.]
MTVDTFFDRSDVASLVGGSVHREAAASLIRSQGWPTRRNEAWHFTDLNARLRTLDLALPAPPPDAASLVPETTRPRLVFVNGRYVEGLSHSLPFVTLRAFEPGPCGSAILPMVALNSAIATEGAAFEIAEGSDAGVVFLVSVADATYDSVISPRHRIVLQADAKLTIVEIAQGRGVYLHNPVIEIELAAGAVLKHYRLQNESIDAVHVTTILVDIGTRAQYEAFTLTCGAKLGRNEIHASLRGPNADVHLNAAQLLSGVQHGDITTVVAHQAPNCSSRQTVKSVLAGAARGVFQGRIEVDRVAQKTDGYQMNQALLLSPDAEIDCKPELEIFADDVKCSHGATIGALDPEQLFYLRSRGIPEAEARAILIRAFLDEALEPVTDHAAREVFETAITEWWHRNKL